MKIYLACIFSLYPPPLHPPSFALLNNLIVWFSHIIISNIFFTGKRNSLSLADAFDKWTEQNSRDRPRLFAFSTFELSSLSRLLFCITPGNTNFLGRFGHLPALIQFIPQSFSRHHRALKGRYRTTESFSRLTFQMRLTCFVRAQAAIFPRFNGKLTPPVPLGNSSFRSRQVWPFVSRLSLPPFRIFFFSFLISHDLLVFFFFFI